MDKEREDKIKAVWKEHGPRIVFDGVKPVHVEGFVFKPVRAPASHSGLYCAVECEGVTVEKGVLWRVVSREAWER